MLAGGTVLLLCLGLIYAYSVLMAPLKVEFDWAVSGMTLIFAISICAFTAGCLVAGSFMKHERAFAGLIIGAALLLVGFLGASQVAGEGSLALIYLTYSVLASLAIGLVYNIIIPVVTSWFPDKPGLAQGICLMGFGGGGFVLGPVVTQLYTVCSWRLVFIGIGIIFAVLVAGGAFVFRCPSSPELTALLEARAPRMGSERPVVAGREADSGEMMRDRVFYLLYLFLFLFGCIGMGVTGIGRELPLSLGADDMTAAFVIGFINIGSGLGRFSGGMLLDSLGCLRTMAGIALIGLAAPIVMIASLAMGNLTVMMVACLLTGMGWGAAVVTMPFVSRKQWGQRNMAQNMAIVNTYSVFASIIGSWGVGLLAEAIGAYSPILVIMAVFAAIGLVDAFMLGRGVDRAAA